MMGPRNGEPDDNGGHVKHAFINPYFSRITSYGIISSSVTEGLRRKPKADWVRLANEPNTRLTFWSISWLLHPYSITSLVATHAE